MKHGKSKRTNYRAPCRRSKVRIELGAINKRPVLWSVLAAVMKSAPSCKASGASAIEVVRQLPKR